jgi:2-polyprenyl-3-methyl-5-hydroxy-6-metoxy-1,4-benzoquinol methylase
MNIAESNYENPNKQLVARRGVEYTRDFIEPFFPANKSAKILDLACGYGLFLKACVDAGYTNIEGQDLVPACVDYAEKTLDLKNIFQSDIFQHIESKENASFDIITAFNIIEHVDRDKVEQLITLISQKLRSGGIFIMEVPNAESPLGIATLFSDLTHQFAFTHGLLSSILRFAGFEKISVTPRYINSNPIIRLGQKIIAKIYGLDDRFMFSGNIIAVGYKK